MRFSNFFLLFIFFSSTWIYHTIHVLLILYTEWCDVSKVIAFLNFKTTPSSPSLQYPSLVAAEIERYFCLLLQWSKELIQLEGHFNNIRDKIRFPENYIFTWFPSTECCKQISESHQTNEDVDKTWLQVNVFVCQNHDGHNITWKYKYDILTGKILKVSPTFLGL